MDDHNLENLLRTRETAESVSRSKPRIQVTSGTSRQILPSNPISQPQTEMASAGTALASARVDLSKNPELRFALEILAKNGLGVAEPKKKYVKHSYEIEEELHREFHEMYAVLGFKHVKTAINAALEFWCTQNRSEFLRRKAKA